MAIQDLRALTVGRPKIEKVTTVDIDGGTFGILSPSIVDVEAIEAASGVQMGSSKTFRDNMSFAIAAVIQLTVDPETKQKVFSRADTDALKAESPSAGWLKTLIEAVGAVMGGQEGNDPSKTDPATSSATPSPESLG